ncbi:MAG: DUF4241 domain-containing protein [Actinophytocola sp.]|uniref:DUF4241 domain-containing protein n=1 Tax=Actinophytocola sp. TaxID=1872138 RepID=UPI003D6AA420
MTVERVYCEGWDPDAHAIVRPLPEADARERDRAGEQYAIVLTGERPLVLIEVCWAAHYAAVWYFDELGRRDRRLVYRRWPNDRLVLLSAQRWAYEPGNLEFHRGEPEWRAPYWRATYEPDGSRQVSSGNWTGPGLEVPTVHLVPDFGRWASIIEDVGEVVPRADPPPAAPPDELPWRPPVPYRPRQLDETFEKGARFELDDGGLVTVDLTFGGQLLLPSGRLIVADPDPWMHEVAPFIEPVAPGEYPLQLSVARFAEAPEHTRVAACALWVSDQPTSSWNNAWREGEHPLLLGDDDFFGVGVDSGRVALVDAAAAEELGAGVEGAYEEMSGWSHELAGESANLITVESGWGDGSYPVWVGRDDGGELTCFVVDFLVLAHAKPVG